MPKPLAALAAAAILTPVLATGAVSAAPQARAADTGTSQLANAQQVTPRRACVGLRVREYANPDRMTVTDRFTAVFRGGNPPSPYTSAAVWFNNTRSPWNHGQRGLSVDVQRWRGWRITGLIVKVASSELVPGGQVYRCPNVFFTR